MADKKISQLTLKTGNMAASDLVEITEGGNTTKSVNGTKIINMVTGGSVVTANTAKTGITSSQANAITANTSKVTNATHSGEVTGATALTIADNIVDEANLKVSNSPTNGHFLSAQSGNTGGLTWAAASGGGGGSMTHVSTATVSGTSTTQVIVAVDNTYKTYKIYASWEQRADSNDGTLVRFTDGGTAVTDNAAYTGARQYNGIGSAVNGNGKMVTAYPDGNLPIASQEWTIFMDGNNIKKVIFSYGITRANQGSSVVAQGTFSPHNYSASGNIDGISWQTGNTQFKAGSTFILYGLAE